MKSIGVRSGAPILQKTAKIVIVRHPAKLSYILGNSFRSSRPEVFNNKVRKTLQNPPENTCDRVSF